MRRIDMWAVLVFIVVASCNAELHPKETVGLHPKKTAVLSADESRIVGGTDTTIEKYPFAVQIYYVPRTLNRCGGSLVSTKHVLTAAACFFSRRGQQNNLSDYTIRASTSMLNSGGSLHTIAAIKVHEQFKYKSRKNNVAVVLMNTTVDVSTSVARPVFFSDQDSVVPDNSLVTAVGWGWTTATKNTEPTFLNEVTVPTINLDTCKARYMNKKWKVPSNSICTGTLYVKPGQYVSKGPCNGDIGGALLYEEIVVGITSFQHDSCDNPKSPFVYVKVASYTKWIKDKINDILNEKRRSRIGSSSKQASSKVGAMTLVTPILYLILGV